MLGVGHGNRGTSRDCLYSTRNCVGTEISLHTHQNSSKAFGHFPETSGDGGGGEGIKMQKKK